VSDGLLATFLYGRFEAVCSTGDLVLNPTKNNQETKSFLT